MNLSPSARAILFSVLGIIGASAPAVPAQELFSTSGPAMRGATIPLWIPEAHFELERLRQLGIARHEERYPGAVLVLVDPEALTDERALAGIATFRRPELARVRFDGLNVETGDPLAGDAALAAIPAHLRSAGTAGSTLRRLAVVQFIGPVKDAWVEDLAATGVRIAGYVPENAYVVSVGAAAQAAFAAFLARPIVRWHGDLDPWFRLAPELRAAPPESAEPIEVSVLVLREAAEFDERWTEPLAAEGVILLVAPESVGPYTVLRARLAAGQAATLASHPDVLAVQPLGVAFPLDEVQAQIVAGNLAGAGPSGPGYLSWLGTRGFTGAGGQFDFVVDVSDDGIDAGFTTPTALNPEFNELGNVFGPSRIAYALDYSGDPLADSGRGHGNLVASALGGFNASSGFPSTSAGGFYLGLGVAPFVRMGNSKIFSNSGAGIASSQAVARARNAWSGEARISNNSWGFAGINVYHVESMIHDYLVRDASDLLSGNQQMTFVFASGNSTGASYTVVAPATAKNVITVGGSEGYRPSESGCGVPGTSADDAGDLYVGSGRGPTADLRNKPDLVAPATHIQGAASRSPAYGIGSAIGVCSTWHPAGQTEYTWASGTSFAVPAVSGAAALLRQHRLNQGAAPPSPALAKAWLMGSARHLTGAGANDALWSQGQGMGRVDLGRTLDGTPRVIVDQTHVFGDSGQVFTLSGTIPAAAEPFRVALVWTDAPALAGIPGSVLVNDLDLEVEVAGTTYRGNVFGGAFSASGGSADALNNAEFVFLPPGASGAFTLTVRASNVPGDGIPGNADLTDQDFALLVHNGVAAADFAVAVAPGALPVAAGSSVTYAISTLPIGGWSQPIDFSAAIGPPHPALSAVPAPGTVAPGSPATLLVTAAPGAPAGTFALSVTATSGATVRTAAAALTVLAPPAIVQPPQPPPGGVLCVDQGASHVFTVQVSGTPPFTYVWRRNGQPVSTVGPTSAATQAYATSLAGAYDVLVSNAWSPPGQPAASPTATFITQTSPTIVTQPTEATVCAGTPVTLSVGATATGTLTYQWYRDGQTVAGATAASHAIVVSATTAGSWHAAVSSLCGSVTSNAVLVTVHSAPEILSGPTVNPPGPHTLGQAVTISITATGTSPLSYQWYRNSAPLNTFAFPTGTADTVDIGALDLYKAGTYYVRVSNACGTVFSTSVTLSLGSPVITQQPSPSAMLVNHPINTVSTSGTNDFYRLGSGFAVLDFNGDGSRDIAISATGTPGATTNPSNRPFCRVNSFRPFALIWSSNHFEPPQSDGSAICSAGDVAGNTADDLAVGFQNWGTPDTGKVVIYSIASGSPSLSIIPPASFAGARLGASVAAVGDLTSDGKSEILIGAPGLATAVVVDPVAPAFTVVRQLSGPAGSDFGVAVASLGDLDGDGVAEHAISTSGQGQGGIGTIRIYDGATGSLLSTVDGASAVGPSAMGFGSRLASGDVTGDGRKELVVGDGGNGSAWVFAFPVGGPPTVMHSLSAGTGAGASVAVNGDMDGDGHGEIIVGSLDSGASVYSGQSGVLLLRYPAPQANEGWGRAVTGLGDADGDGIADLAMGAPLADFYVGIHPILGIPTYRTDIGVVHVLRGPGRLCAGGSTILSASAIGTPSLSYQWRWNGQPIPGETTPNLSIPGAVPAVLGTFDLVVTDGLGATATSHPVSLLPAGAPPAINSHPLTQTVSVGAPVTFSVAASGFPLSYQWRKDGAPIAGATAMTHAIASATPQHAGSYDVVVSDGCSSVGSTSATLIVVVPAPIVIAGPPAPSPPAPHCVGQVVTLSIQASFSQPLDYQWRKDGIPIAGATAPMLQLGALQTSEAGVYDVVVSSGPLSLTSPAFTVVAPEPVQILVHPGLTTICGSGTPLTVGVGGSPPFTYQWRRDGAPEGAPVVSSSVTNTLIATVPGSYEVVVSNGCGSATSSTLVAGSAPLMFLTHPISQCVWTANVPATFTVQAVGGGYPATAIQFRWFRNGALLSGASGPSIGASQSGTYWAEARNTACDPTWYPSQSATLTVFAGTNPTVFIPSHQTAIEWTIGPSSVAGYMSCPFSSGEWNNAGIGSSMTRVDDVNGDGVADFACGAPGYWDASSNPGGPQGIVFMISGQTRLPLWCRYPAGPDAWGNAIVSGELGPIPGGGTTQEIIVKSGPGYLQVLNGATGNPISQVPIGLTNTTFEPTSLVFLGDTDGNGYGEVAFGTLLGVHVVEPDGVGGWYQWSTTSPAGLSGFGTTLARLDDVNGDGRADFAVSAPGSNLGGSTYGSVHILSSAPTSSPTAALPILATIPGLALAGPLAGSIGPALANVGDLDGDGRGELAVGSDGPGKVWILKIVPGAPPTFTVLFEIDGGDPGFGTNISTAGDVNLDGIGDVLVGSEGIGATIHSGATGEFLYRFGASSLAVGDGTLVLGLGDIDSDGRPEFAVGGNGVIRILGTDPWCFGSPVHITALATSQTPVTFQWRRNGVAIPLATGPTLTVPDFNAATIGVYDVRVDNGCGSVVSLPVALSQGSGGPLITGLQANQQPVAQGQVVVCTGTALTLAVQAVPSGGGSLEYQWDKNGNAAPGTNNTVEYVVDTAIPNGSGDTYSVTVTEALTGCSAVSGGVTVTINAAGPWIAAATPNESVCPGGTAQFSVTVSGTPPFSYQWSRDVGAGFVPISGANQDTLTITNAAPADSGTYKVVASNLCGSTEHQATLTVCTVPVFNDHPDSLTVHGGSAAMLAASIAARPAGCNVTWQWLKDGAPVPGATGPMIIIPSTTAADAGVYRAEVTGCATVTSNPATLTVIQSPIAPAILLQPQGVTVATGAPAGFSVLATGAPVLTYQWWRTVGGPPEVIPGATASAFSLGAVTPADAGTYHVVVSNGVGSVTSAAATLTVLVPPVFTLQPVSQDVCAGAPVTFTANATGSDPITWQWLRDAVPVGGNAPVLTIPAAGPGDAGEYRVVATNGAGAATSTAATLQVGAPPIITLHPAGQTVCAGSTATFTASASGSPSLAWQWRRDGTAVPGATSDTLVLNSVASTASGTYDALVLDGPCTTATQAAVLTVVDPPTFTTTPPPQITAASGSTVTLVVGASGGQGITFQWWKDAAPLAGATSPTLVLSPVAVTDAGTYHCELGLGPCVVPGPTTVLTVINTLGAPPELARADQVNDPPPSVVLYGAGAWQSFTPGQPSLRLLDLRALAGDGYPAAGGTMSVQLHQGIGTAGTVLAAASTVLPPGQTPWVSLLPLPFRFDPPVALTPGTLYTFSYDAAQLPFGAVSLLARDDNPYPGGTAGLPVRDLNFTTWADAGIAAAVGLTTLVLVRAPEEELLPYVCGFALGTVPGIPLGDGRTIPLNLDPLLLIAIDPLNPFFTGVTGSLDVNGLGRAAIHVPNVPALAGFPFFGAYLVVNPLLPTNIGTLSPAVPIVIQ